MTLHCIDICCFFKYLVSACCKALRLWVLNKELLTYSLLTYLLTSQHSVCPFHSDHVRCHILLISVTHRNITRFPTHAWISCVAPDSICPEWIRIATVVLCCCNSAVGKINIRNKTPWHVRCIQRPLLTRSSTNSRSSRSRVIISWFREFTVWTKVTRTSFIS